MKKLTGQALADAFAKTYRLWKMPGIRQPRYIGKVWASYDGGGWITLRGEGLRAHPDLRKMYPNGWSLFQRFRSGEARQRVLEFRSLP